MQDPYLVLNLPRTATQEDIDTAYRRMARVYHPDRGETADERMFDAIGQARRLLSDPELRADYDRSGLLMGSEEEKKARKNLKGIFVQFLDATKGVENPFSSMRGELDRMNGEARLDKLRLERLRSRIKNKRAGAPNTFDEVLAMRIGVLDDMVKDIACMLLILDMFDYEDEPQLEAPAYNGVFQ